MPTDKRETESTMTTNLSPAASESLDKARAAMKAAFGSMSPDRMALLGGGISGASPYRGCLQELCVAVRDGRTNSKRQHLTGMFAFHHNRNQSIVAPQKHEAALQIMAGLR